MVLTSIYTTDAEVMQKAGASVSASWTDAMGTAAALQGESMINVMTNVIWAVDAAAFTALSISYKYILSDVVSSFIAKQAIAYDMSGYYGDEATIMLNINDDTITKGIQVLRDTDAKGAMGV